MKIRANIRVNGIVQGVGFRPFIHKQVSSRSLTGWVRNTSSGAEIELEGQEQEINDFAEELRHHGPRLSLIASVLVQRLPELAGYTDFRIIESKGEKKRNTLISPDVSICEDCLREMYSPGRRYRYPFINCTNCGPRFTIIRDVPYDRRQTTMGVFAMCPDCQSEYTDINDRRYHAEPTGCNICGPCVQLLDSEGRVIADKTVTEPLTQENLEPGTLLIPGPDMPLDGDPVDMARSLLLEGKILAVKGLGGYHLACRMDIPGLVEKLRRRKRRDEKPFAIMCRDLEAVRELCLVSPDEERVLTGVRRPIVLLRKKPGVSLSAVSENGRIGVMLPYTPVHYMLFERDLKALIMTSANLSDLPIVFKNQEAVRSLKGIADAFLVNNREIHVRCDDSLCYVYDGQEYPVRRSRGFVPYPVILWKDLPCILACGAEQKASFTISRGNYAFPSQHIGDMKNMETLENYETQIKHFERIFDVKPEALACDLHPDYISTGYALERSETEGIPLIQIQHHHAHMASCMADNDLTGQVIGLIWDGVGYGEDGNAWGGEFLTGGYEAYERRGQIRYIRLPGGDKATHELWRTGISLLLEAGVEPSGLPGIENVGASGAAASFTAEQIALVKHQLELNINCPLSSGMGRLFDGVAAILGIKIVASYEGQGAILLEAAAGTSQKVLKYDIINKFGTYELDWVPMIKDLYQRLAGGEAAADLAAAFMNTLAEAATEITSRIADDTGLDRVVLSGGTFNNMYLMDRMPELLRRRGLTVYHHHRVSCGDEGLSLGQLMIAASKMNRE